MARKHINVNHFNAATSDSIRGDIYIFESNHINVGQDKWTYCYLNEIECATNRNFDLK